MTPMVREGLRKIVAAVRDAFSPGAARERAPGYWERVPAVAAALAARETGGGRFPGLCAYALGRWGSRLRSQPLDALAVGVSHCPDLPERLLATGRVGRVLAVDDDAAALENLAERRLPGVECWQMDLDRDPLPRGPFDVVAARDVLHRLRGVERFGAQVERVLDRSGMFIAREYVGPNRLQFPEEQMALVNALLALLPERLRQAPDMDEPMERQFAPDLAEVMRFDPTFAVCAEDVEKMVYLHFRVLEEIPLGGTLLAPLLANIGGCFAAGDAEAGRVLAALLDAEMRLIAGGLIRCDYKAYIARPG